MSTIFNCGLFLFALNLCVARASPVQLSHSVSLKLADGTKVPHNIAGRIIDPNDNTFEINNGPVMRMPRRDTLSATTETAAGITRSSLGFMKISQSTSGLILPAKQMINYDITLKGKVSFKGFQTTSIESAVTKLARQSSASFFNKFEDERKNLKSSAEDKYFWFFQAASNFGYTNNAQTSTLINDDIFKSLSETTKKILKSNERQTLEAQYEGRFQGISTGEPGLLKLFGYILINQVTLDSGETINIAKPGPELVVANEKGDVVGKIEKGASVKDPVNINGLVLDVKQGS